MFSLETFTLTFICYANLFVFFLLVHDVSVSEKQLICIQSRVLNLYGVNLVNFSLLVVFIFIYFLNACLCFAIALSFWKNFGGSNFFLSPFAPFSVLALFVPGQFWDHLCPGIWDHLCPGIWDHLCPGIWDHQCPGIWDHPCPGIWDHPCPRIWDHPCPGIWDHLCPRAWDDLCPRAWDLLCPLAWDHLCPAYMELRVNSRCHLRIVCVYLTCFLNLRVRDNLCPLPDMGLSVPSIYGVAC